jgi:hypothetical protein
MEDKKVTNREILSMVMRNTIYDSLKELSCAEMVKVSEVTKSLVGDILLRNREFQEEQEDGFNLPSITIGNYAERLTNIIRCTREDAQRAEKEIGELFEKVSNMEKEIQHREPFSFAFSFLCPAVEEDSDRSKVLCVSLYRSGGELDRFEPERVDGILRGIFRIGIFMPAYTSSGIRNILEENSIHYEQSVHQTSRSSPVGRYSRPSVVEISVAHDGLKAVEKFLIQKIKEVEETVVSYLDREAGDTIREYFSRVMVEMLKGEEENK